LVCIRLFALHILLLEDVAPYNPSKKMRRKLNPSIALFSTPLEEAFVDGETANDRHRQRLLFREVVKDLIKDTFDVNDPHDRELFRERLRASLTRTLIEAQKPPTRRKKVSQHTT